LKLVDNTPHQTQLHKHQKDAVKAKLVEDTSSSQNLKVESEHQNSPVPSKRKDKVQPTLHEPPAETTKSEKIGHLPLQKQGEPTSKPLGNEVRDFCHLPNKDWRVPLPD
jgi:hypothetical protein